MNHGRQATLFGPWQFLKCLGAQPRQALEIVSEAHCAVLWKDLVALADTAPPVAAPKSSAEAEQLMDSVLFWLASFPSCWKAGTECGRSALHRGYVRKSIARKFFLFFQRHFGAAVWGDIQFGVMQRRLPDVCGMTKNLLPTLSVDAISRKFGMNACLVSGWACLLKSVAPEHREAFLCAESTELAALAAVLVRYGVPPSARTLAAHFALGQPGVSQACPNVARKRSLARKQPGVSLAARALARKRSTQVLKKLLKRLVDATFSAYNHSLRPLRKMYLFPEYNVPT